MIKLKLKLKEGDPRELETKEFSFRKEGLAFFDPEIEMVTILTWDKLESYSIEGVVSKEQIEQSIAYQKAMSDKNPRFKRGLNTSTSL